MLTNKDRLIHCAEWSYSMPPVFLHGHGFFASYWPITFLVVVWFNSDQMVSKKYNLHRLQITAGSVSIFKLLYIAYFLHISFTKSVKSTQHYYDSDWNPSPPKNCLCIWKTFHLLVFASGAQLSSARSHKCHLIIESDLGKSDYRTAGICT